MKKTMIKAALAGSMLFSLVLGQVVVMGTGVANAEASTATTKPVMDNLSQYGLKKDLELPVTVTAGGLSYTLHKVMIFDYESTAAIALRDKYQYAPHAEVLSDPEYFVWTKITIANNSKKTVERSVKDMFYKWRLFFESGGEAYPAMSAVMRTTPNSKEALRNFTLKPGESLTTYQALYYKGKFDFLRIGLRYNNQYVDKYVVNELVSQ
ncbi:hypothetical protein [Paenibacillus sp. sgz500992]|uniref:hypothetical protein n=1 Tax=Paenibacillus sp. sgz500992 TaxID=3242476 RepID=UPI0036D35E80